MKVKMWACVWKDIGEVVEEYMDGATFLHLFRTREEARKHVREDRQVVRVEVSVKRIK